MDDDGVDLGVSLVVPLPQILLLAALILTPLLLEGTIDNDCLFAPDHKVGVLAFEGHEGHGAARTVLAVLHDGGVGFVHLHTITIDTMHTHVF